MEKACKDCINCKVVVKRTPKGFMSVSMNTTRTKCSKGMWVDGNGFTARPMLYTVFRPQFRFNVPNCPEYTEATNERVICDIANFFKNPQVRFQWK